MRTGHKWISSSARQNWAWEVVTYSHWRQTQVKLLIIKHFLHASGQFKKWLARWMPWSNSNLLLILIVNYTFTLQEMYIRCTLFKWATLLKSNYVKQVIKCFNTRPNFIYGQSWKGLKEDISRRCIKNNTFQGILTRV